MGIGITAGAIIIAIILFPGIIFRRTFFRYPFSYQASSTISNDFFGILISAVVIHLLFFTVLYSVFGEANFYRRDIIGVLQSILEILTYKYSSPSNFFKLNFFPAIFYGIIVLCFSYMHGIAINVLIRKKGLDIKYSTLKFKNDWYYIFKGVQENSVFTVVYALIDTIDGSYLYRGLLKDFTINKQGELAKIILLGAQCRPLKNDNNVTFRNIPNYSLVLDGAIIKSLNILYYKSLPEEGSYKELIKQRTSAKIEDFYYKTVFIIDILLIFGISYHLIFNKLTNLY